jgi:hypothetical protein
MISPFATNADVLAKLLASGYGDAVRWRARGAGMWTGRGGGRMRTSIATVVVGTALMVGTAGASLTQGACLAKKLKEWGKLRKCQATENAKALETKPANLAKCEAEFDMKLASLSQQAAATGIACRYEVNGDGTATDYDTGLQWEQKTDDGSVHDKDDVYSWTTSVGGTRPNGTAFTDFLGTLNNDSSDFAAIDPWSNPRVKECVPEVMLGSFR